jgi:hypothetical protein
VQNWPEVVEPLPGGWSSTDSETLIALAEETKHTQRIAIFGLAVLIFLVSGLIVLSLRAT